jgi:exportin-1
LQILEKLIQTRWNALPREQCEGIKNYIVTLIIRYSSEEASMKQERILLNKLNLILVQVLKQEWPKNWPTFISELISSSRTSISLCENNMAILKLLSEEVFDYSAEQMTTVKAKNLKSQLCGEFAEVFQLCTEVLEKAQKPSLIASTLEALLRFLKWIPLGYIFETALIENLKSRFLTVPLFRNVTLKCLTEITALTIGSEYDSKFVHLFQSVMDSLSLMIQYSQDLDLAKAYQNSSDEEQKLIQNLALFFSTCLGNHLKVLETHVNREVLLLSHMYLLKISLVDDREVFKVCLEYWTKLVSDLYNEYPFVAMESSGLFLGSIAHTNSRRALYGEILSSLRLVMIERMVKPEEVLIVEDENGEIVRESIKETDTITLYKSMREVLVYLTHLDYEDTENLMTEKLSRQFDGSEWSWNNLNKLCWAIGSISGAMNEEVEKRFLVNIIRDLLGLTEMKRGKDNKAVVASNIMYIVGQYPRFLKAHWKFLKTVINKLFEFMHEMHEGVQDMACDTFIKISKKCRRHFVVLQPGESTLFVDEILSKLPSIICDLQPSQVHTFYEAIGYMIQSQSDSTIQSAETGQLMSLPNGSWDTVMSAAAQNVDILKNTETLKSLSNILRSNVRACESIGSAFSVQMSRIYMDMLSLYRAVSSIISDSVSQQGVIATKTPVVRAMRAVKKDILRLAEIFISKVEDPQAVSQTFIPPLFDAILGDYSRNVEQARDAEVLSVTAATINKLTMHMEDKILPILSAVFECTLNMINKDFSEYPEHRANFFKLLSAINSHCFTSLLRLPPSQFKLIVDSILWSIKHTHRDISDTGLNMLLQLLQNMSQADPSVAAPFYRDYFLNLLQDIFYVLTDTDHKAGFKFQSAILAHMFQAVSSGSIPAPIFDTSKYPNMDNRAYLESHMLNLLSNAFPHLQRYLLIRFPLFNALGPK